MGLIFGDINKALSAKLCYSKYLSSTAVILLTVALATGFFFYENLTTVKHFDAHQLYSSIE
jgi:hypothetical protein